MLSSIANLELSSTDGLSGCSLFRVAGDHAEEGETVHAIIDSMTG
jgi:hypothetical protein